MSSPLLPLIILLVVLTVFALIGYVVYTVATDIADKTSQQMEKKNLKLSKEGLKVGVREVREEDYVGRTQSVLVNVWNYSTWPSYKSRFWNKENEKSHGQAQPQSRVPYGRTTSSVSGAGLSKK